MIDFEDKEDIVEKGDISKGYNSFLQKVIVGIGEVAEMTNIPVRKLRYWESKGLIKAVDSTVPARRFDLANIKKIILIQELIEDGYSLDGAAAKIEKRIERISSLMGLIQIK